MGHYDDCYASDAASKRKITKADIESLEKEVIENGSVTCYIEDYAGNFKIGVAHESKKLTVAEDGYKVYSIMTNAGAIEKAKKDKEAKKKWDEKWKKEREDEKKVVAEIIAKLTVNEIKFLKQKDARFDSLNPRKKSLV